MKQTIFFIVIFGIIVQSAAQQIPLKGVVAVQNSKTNTGKTQYVKNAEVTHPNAKNDVTDDDGKFTLNITGLKQNTQTQIAVVLSDFYGDYVVVNEKELRDITLGRVTPICVYVCKRGELEQRQAEMIGINMRKLEERMEADKKRLQNELESLKAKNDYLNARYGEIKDSLNIISKNIDKAFERIKEYAQSMVLENLDDKDNNYINAYNCFAKGELDSVKYYLKDEDLDKKYQKLLLLKAESEKEKELIQILTESVSAKAEYYENGISDLLKEWLLLVQTSAMQNKYEETEMYFMKVIQADTSNVKNRLKFADYLCSVREYAKAETYYRQCFEKYCSLGENRDAYMADIAQIFNSLAILHRAVIEYPKALIEFEEALTIYEKLNIENPKTYLIDVARTLNNLANLHLDMKEYSKSLEKYDKALGFFHTLAAENPQNYAVYFAQIYNNSARVHQAVKEYPKALESYEEALKIRRKLAQDNPKAYLADLAQTLNNLANLHSDMEQYSKAMEEYEEALKIRYLLAEENPKAYVVTVAHTLNNLAILHLENDEYPKALEKMEDALKIYQNLAKENPTAYLYYMAIICRNLAELYQDMKEYPNALEKYKESLKNYNELADKTPKIYLKDIVEVLSNLSWCYILVKEYIQAEQSAREALELDNTQTEVKIYLAHALLFQNRFPEAEKIYKELSQVSDMGKLLLESFDELEKAAAIPEEHKADVDKIREIIIDN